MDWNAVDKLHKGARSARQLKKLSAVPAVVLALLISLTIESGVGWNLALEDVSRVLAASCAPELVPLCEKRILLFSAALAYVRLYLCRCLPIPLCSHHR